SQNEQDSRHYARAAKIPMVEPADSAEGLAFAKIAYELSERFDTPVLLKMCTRVSHSQSVVEPGERVEAPAKPYEKNGAKYIMMPGNAKRRHPVVEARTQALTEYAETTPFNRVEDRKSVVQGKRGHGGAHRRSAGTEQTTATWPQQRRSSTPPKHT